MFREVARLPAGQRPSEYPIATSCPADQMCWQPGTDAALANLMGRAPPGREFRFACRVHALQGGLIRRTSDHGLGRMAAARDDQIYVANDGRSWPELLERGAY